MPHLSSRRLLRASALLLFAAQALLCAVAASANGSEIPACSTLPRPCDTLWLISTRKFPCGDPRPHVNDLTYEVRDDQGKWQRADLASFLATDDERVTTVIWIHGNRNTSGEARNRGWATYRALARCSTCDTPMRFVIFSWPGERIDGGPLDDIRVKAARTNPNGYYLAWLIDQIGGDVPISVMGYSYGARIATGGLHLLGGGTLNRWTLDERVHPHRRPMHVVLVAAALDNHWLIPGHRHGNALSQVEHLTNIYNSCDRALQRYHYLYCRRSDADALGYTGIAGLSRLGADRDKVMQIDACCYVGKEHTWELYLANDSIMACVRRELLPPLATEVAHQ